METGQPNRRKLSFGRIARLSILVIALLAAFLAGAAISVWENIQGRESSVLRIFDSFSSLTAPFKQRADGHEPEIPVKEEEPAAIRERTAAMHRDAAAILAECRSAAGGNWDKWQSETAKYRAALKARIDALKDRPDLKAPNTECTYEALAGQDDFPLFEVNSRLHLDYLCDPATLDSFRSTRPVAAAKRWLKQRGIDLIFIPVPKMTEVYIDHFITPCPVDGIIAPHVRRTLLELLQDDVEVIDGLTLFRPMRDVDSEYLYNTVDAHWAPRAMRIMVNEVARRMERYRFGAQARYSLPIVRATPGPYKFRDSFGDWRGYGLHLLYPEQARRASSVQTTTQSRVLMVDGSEPIDDPASPVMLIGNSYGWDFREQLVKELNLLIASRVAPLQSTESFADFLREPGLLSRCRVVVWITTEQHLTRFKPLPGPVADCAGVPHLRPGKAPPELVPDGIAG